MNRESRKCRLERFSRNEKIFPGEDHATAHCGACARIIADRLGGEVRGYWHNENPTATVGEVEGGHDFAVTADRFLVDPWLFHYYAESPVLDLDVPGGQGGSCRAIRTRREVGAGAKPCPRYLWQTETLHPLITGDCFQIDPGSFVHRLAETRVLDREASEVLAETSVSGGVPERRRSLSDLRARKTRGRKGERQEISVPYAIIVAQDSKTLHLLEIMAGVP